MVQHYLEVRREHADVDYPWPLMPPELPPRVALDDYFVEHTTDYFAATSGIALRRHVLERIMPLPTGGWRLCADICLSRPAPLFGSVVTLREALGCYRIHGNNNWMGSRDRADFCKNFRDRVAFTNEWLERTGDPRRIQPLRNPLYRRRRLKQALLDLLAPLRAGT
jgi:hypothetical protein